MHPIIPDRIRLVKNRQATEEKKQETVEGLADKLDNLFQKVGDLTSYTKLKYMLLLINKFRCIIYLNIRKKHINAEVQRMLYTYEDAVTKFGSKYL